MIPQEQAQGEGGRGGDGGAALRQEEDQAEPEGDQLRRGLGLGQRVAAAGAARLEGRPGGGEEGPAGAIHAATRRPDIQRIE